MSRRSHGREASSYDRERVCWIHGYHRISCVLESDTEAVSNTHEVGQ